MTPILPTIMLGAAIAMLCLEVANAYMHIIEAQYREDERKQKAEAAKNTPRRAVDWEWTMRETDLRSSQNEKTKKKAAPSA